MRIGSAWESPEQAGYSHFLEHLCFKSTRDFSYNEISALVTSLGGNINAYTDFDGTCFHLLLPSEHWQQGLIILSQLARFPAFNGKDVEMEKDIISEEIRQYENDPESSFIEYIQTTCFIDSPLRHPVMGSVGSVRQASFSKLCEFLQQYYRPDNCFLVLTGDLNPAKVEEQIEHLFADWSAPAQYLQHDPAPYLEPEINGYRFFERQRRQEYLAIVLPELAESHPLSDAMLVALRHMAIGRASRLYKLLVEKEKLCSEVKISSLSGTMSGVTVIQLNPIGKNHCNAILSVVAQVLVELQQGLLDQAEFELIKLDIIHGWLYGFDTMENLANMLGGEEFILGYEKLYEYGDRIAALTREQVQECVRRYYTLDSISIYHQAGQSVQIDFPGLWERSFRAIPTPGLGSSLSVTAVLADQAPEQMITNSAVHSETGCFTTIAPGYYQARFVNGITLLYKHIPSRPVCGFALSTDVSQLDEDPAHRGANFLCTTAMLHSTHKHSHEQIMQLCRRIGLNIRVEQHLDSTTFRGKCFPASLEQALGILAELYLEPALQAPYIQLLKSAAKDSLRRDRQNPFSHAYQRWFRMLFGAHSPYDCVCGNIQDLDRLNVLKINSWHRQWYLGRPFHLALVGSVEPEHILEMVGRIFRYHSVSQPSPKPNPPKVVPQKTRYIVERTDGSQAIIHLGGFAPPALNRTHTTAFHILAQVLGGDMESRFFNLLREKYGYAYQTGMEYISIHGLGYWNANAYCDLDDFKPCLKLMREIIGEVRQRGIEPEELQTAQNYLCGLDRFERESVSSQAAAMSNLSALGYEPEFYLNREQRIRAISVDTVNDAAGAWLDPANLFSYILL